MGESEDFLSERGQSSPYYFGKRALNCPRKYRSKWEKPSEEEKEEEEEDTVYTFSTSWSSIYVYKGKKNHPFHTRWTPYFRPLRERLLKKSTLMEEELERARWVGMLRFWKRFPDPDLKTKDHLPASPKDQPGFSSQDQASGDHQSSTKEGIPAATTWPQGPSTSDLSGAEACEALDAFKRLSVSASTSVDPKEGDLED